MTAPDYRPSVAASGTEQGPEGKETGGDRIDPFYADLGRRISAARRSAGITQVEFGKAFGLTRSSIANLERGHQRPPLHVVVEMATMLGFEVPGLSPGAGATGVAIAAAARARAECQRLAEALEQITTLAHDARWPKSDQAEVSP